MTETKKLTINKIDSKDTYESLIAKGFIGDEDISLVEGDFAVVPSADAKTGEAADAKAVWDMIGNVRQLIDEV